MAVIIEDLEVIEPPPSAPEAPAAAQGAAAGAGGAAELDEHQLQRALQRQQWLQARLHAD
jgi:hypothetical protein